MTKKLLSIAVVVFTLILSQSGIAKTQENQFLSFWGCGDEIKNTADTLKLNDAQLAQIKIIKAQLKISQKENWTQMKSLHEQINQQIQSDVINQLKTDSLINTKTQLIGSILRGEILAKHYIYNVLNEQQKVQYKQMQKNCEEKME